MEESVEIIPCFACITEVGYITMNCATHKEKKMLCKKCWTEKGAPLMCVEQNCGKQVHVKYETVQLMTWDDHVRRVRDFFRAEALIAVIVVLLTVSIFTLPVILKLPFVKLGKAELINDTLAGFVWMEHFCYFIFILVAILIFATALNLKMNNLSRSDSDAIIEPTYRLLFMNFFNIQPKYNTIMSKREIAVSELFVRFLCLYVISLLGAAYCIFFSLTNAAYLDITGTFVFFVWCCYLYKEEFAFMGAVYRASFWMLLEKIFYTRQSVIL